MINIPIEQLLIQTKGKGIDELLLQIQRIHSSCSNIYNTSIGSILMISSSYTDPDTSDPFIVGVIIPLTGNSYQLTHHSLLKTIMNNVQEIIFYKNIDGRYVDANKACYDFFALQGIHEFIGKTDIEME